MEQLNLPELLDILLEKDLNLIQDCKILIQGGTPAHEESKLAFKNKANSLQESLSSFRNKLNFLLNTKRIEILKYEGDNLDSFDAGKRRSKEDRKSEMYSTDSQYYDMNLVVNKYECLLRYCDDVYFILMSMIKNI
jgi:hypothetical protein